MGFTSVVLVNNDALDYIKNDSTFGNTLARAVTEFGVGGYPTTASANYDSGRGGFSPAAMVVSCDHADHTQFLAVNQNWGTKLKSNTKIPDDVLKELIRIVAGQGYLIFHKNDQRD